MLLSNAGNAPNTQVQCTHGIVAQPSGKRGNIKATSEFPLTLKKQQIMCVENEKNVQVLLFAENHQFIKSSVIYRKQMNTLTKKCK